MAGIAAHSAVPSVGRLVSPLRRLHLGGWRRWVVVALAVNLALGMGFSVVALRHQADARSHTDALLADLDAAASAQEAALWHAVAYAGSTAGVSTAAQRVQNAAARAAVTGDDPRLQRALAAYLQAGDQVRVVVVRGRADQARIAIADTLLPAARALHDAITAAAQQHREANASAGVVADAETLFVMLFAALMAGLLFRRFQAARRSGEEGVAKAQARFRALVQNFSDVLTLTDAGLVIGYQTPSVTRLLGWSADELTGTRLAELAHPEDRLALLTAQDEAVRGGRDAEAVSHVRLRHRDGSWRHVQSIHTNLLADPDVHAVVVTTRDVTAQKQLEEQLQHNAFHDALTGLANRALFSDRLAHALARTDRGAAPVAVLFIDLDDFKAVNDGSGHTAGDQLLMAVAERLRRVLRPSDTIARLGGDEFAVLIEDAADPSRIQATADRLLAALAEPFPVQGVDGEEETRVGASVGIATGAAGQHDAAELLRHADVAMYAAKQAGKGRSAAFAPDMDSSIIGQLRLKAELARAVENGEFAVYYQPTVELASGRLAGVEALVRWQHPERGLVPPMDFIPLAEQTGLIVPIGRFVLREACRQTAAWQAAYPASPPITVSVNLSARELDEPGLVDSVRDALAAARLDPAHLVLEITETLLLVDLPRTVAKLLELRTLGVRLAIDDFGTGYSSLSYLENLPVDILKIDKSFVDRIGEPTPDDDGAQPVMVAAISQLGHALRLQLVAEGIEQPEQVTLLRDLHCHYGQGYYFARPLEAGALAELLHERGAAPDTASLNLENA